MVLFEPFQPCRSGESSLGWYKHGLKILSASWFVAFMINSVEQHNFYLVPHAWGWKLEEESIYWSVQNNFKHGPIAVAICQPGGHLLPAESSGTSPVCFMWTQVLVRIIVLFRFLTESVLVHCNLTASWAMQMWVFILQRIWGILLF